MEEGLDFRMPDVVSYHNRPVFLVGAMLEDDGFADFSVLMHCGVYALVRLGVVVYIGKSKSIGERTLTHIRHRRKSAIKRTGMFSNRLVAGIQFDAIWVRRCMLAELDQLEVEMIRKYQPRYNKQMKEAPPPIDISELLKNIIPMEAHREPPIRRRV